MKALGKGSIASIVEIGLTITWYVLWAAAVCLVVAALGYATFMALVSAGAVDPATVPNQGDIRIEFGGIDTESIRGLGWTEWQVFAPGLLIAGVSVGGSLIIVSRLRRLFDSFSSSKPFQRENAEHLRVIWITMVVIEVARYLLTVATAALVMAFNESHGVGVRDIKVTVDLSTWGSILILIVLAEVFREGARLREEQELTI